jgi:uncharacterized protein YcnI
VSLPHPARRLPVVLLATSGALAGLLAVGAGVASAHVTVSSANAAPGGYGTVTFSVPDESDVASTVGLRIQLPTDTPITSVRAQRVPGWTVSLTTVALDRPVRSEDGGTIDSAVSVVEYRADADGGIPPGEFQEFSLSGGPFPDAVSLAFNVVQSFSDGTEAAWIEPSVAGQPEPAHPAPVLSLSSATTGSAGSDTRTTSAGSDGGVTTATVALGLSVVGLLAGLTALFLGLSARRRTVSS